MTASRPPRPRPGRASAGRWSLWPNQPDKTDLIHADGHLGLGHHALYLLLVKVGDAYRADQLGGDALLQRLPRVQVVHVRHLHFAFGVLGEQFAALLQANAGVLRGHITPATPGLPLCDSISLYYDHTLCTSQTGAITTIPITSLFSVVQDMWVLYVCNGWLPKFGTDFETP